MTRPTVKRRRKLGPGGKSVFEFYPAAQGELARRLIVEIPIVFAAKQTGRLIMTGNEYGYIGDDLRNELSLIHPISICFLLYQSFAAGPVADLDKLPSL